MKWRKLEQKVHLPADVPRLRPFLQQRSTGTHIEHVLETFELGFVRKKLTIRILSVVQRFEEGKREYFRRCPVGHRIGDHHWSPRIRVSVPRNGIKKDTSVKNIKKIELYKQFRVLTK